MHSCYCKMVLPVIQVNGTYFCTLFQFVVGSVRMEGPSISHPVSVLVWVVSVDPNVKVSALGVCN